MMLVSNEVGMFESEKLAERLQAALSASEQWFRDVAEALPAAIYLTDAAGRITFHNQAAAMLWGRSPEPGKDQWCGSWRLYWPDGRPMPHDECPLAVALKENRPTGGAEAIAERPDGTRVPFLSFPTSLRDASGALAGAVNMLVDITAFKEAENKQRLLMRELNHRVKNILATVQAIASQTLSEPKSPADFMASLTSRIQALYGAHNLLAEGWHGVDLVALLREQLCLDPALDDERITRTGPEIILDSQTAQHLALALHELGVNARKYGALSASEGRLAVHWAIEAKAKCPHLKLRWVESGGPQVIPPDKPGFGTVLIEQSIRQAHGKADIRFEPDGVTCDIDLPLHTLSPSHARAVNPASPATVSTRAALRRSQPRAAQPASGCPEGESKRILVIEDEALVALDIQTSLVEAGIEVVGPACTPEQALQLIASAAFDGALLDANLAGRAVDGIAAALTQRGIPFAFVTGYGRESLPAAFREAVTIEKPFEAYQLVQTARQLTSCVPGPTAGAVMICTTLSKGKPLQATNAALLTALGQEP